jgi:hypothetical protein
MILAYIDPGSGALAWQLTVAALMGFLFYLSKIRSVLVKGFRSLFRIDSKKAEPLPPPDAKKD